MSNHLDLQFDRLSLGAVNGNGHAMMPSQQLQPLQQHSNTVPNQNMNVNKLDIPRRRGIVKFFNSLKGFGFVVDNDPGALGGQEVFCHFSAISGKGGFRSLAEGEEVEYELVQGPKGFQAANLTGPGGRSVVGDPKARLAKPPPYMPFAPLGMPLNAAYLGDHLQHPGVFAASPYTQHVVYIPSTMAMSPSGQYAYAHPGFNISGGGNDRSPSGPGFNPRSAYQAYAPTGPVVASNYPAQSPASTNGHPASNYGQKQPQAGASDSLGLVPSQAAQSTSRVPSGSSSSAALNGSHSPPSQPTSFGFAPFSPPVFNNAPLFGSTGGSGRNGPSSLPPPLSNSPPSSSLYLPQTGRQPSNGLRSASPFASGPSSAATGISNSVSNLPSGSALFGGGGTTASPSIGPIGTGSRSATPREDRRGTPLGNGSLSASGSDWKAPILYTSAGDFA